MTEPPLSLVDAAQLLGYPASGLRKTVNRTKWSGQGPKIRFFRVGSGPITFTREWIEAFLDAHTVISGLIKCSPAQRRERNLSQTVQHGFDPKLFRRSADGR
jgi:hypothetical protein